MDVLNNFLEMKGDLLKMVGTGDDGWVLPDLLEEERKVHQCMRRSCLILRRRKTGVTWKACGHLIMIT